MNKQKLTSNLYPCLEGSGVMQALLGAALLCMQGVVVAAQPETDYPTYSGVSDASAVLAPPEQTPLIVDLAEMETPDYFKDLLAAKPKRLTSPLFQAGISPLTATPPSVYATLGLNLLGTGTGFPGFSMTGEPSDVNGSVGATQYVQWVNSQFTVFNKATGAAVQGPLNGNQLFAGLPSTSICRTTNSGDPVAQYDKLAKRWVLTQFAITAGVNGQYGQCIAVSQTSDATGAWNVYQYTFTDFPDYPKLSIWPDGYYITYNMFSHLPGNAYLYAKTCAYDRAAMLAGNPVATSICFNVPNNYSLLPSDLDGTNPPPTGAPNPQFEFGADFSGTSLWRYLFHVDFTTPANSTLTGPTVIPVTPWTFTCSDTGGPCVTQPVTFQTLDTLGDRLMYRVAYRNFVSRDSVTITHSVDTGNAGHTTGVRWYEIRSPLAATPTVYQQATLAPDTDHRWMPSVAMDKAGNILIGYSRSSLTTYPSIYYTGRLRSEPRGYLEGERLIIGGTGYQQGHGRWGDYSSMSVDPVDDCTFWYTQQYTDSPSGDFIWKTRVANAKFPNCQ